MPLSGTPLGRDLESGVFQLPDSRSILRELHEMLTCIDCDKVQFMANHASNYLPISGRLGRDKNAILASIERAISGSIALVPEQFRAL
jgi:hypothetical protein